MLPTLNLKEALGNYERIFQSMIPYSAPVVNIILDGVTRTLIRCKKVKVLMLKFALYGIRIS
jgi:hypothetical protein